MSRVVDEMYGLFNKTFTYILVAILSIGGKIGLDLMNKKALSLRYILGFTMVALFVSAMTGLFCYYKNVNPILSYVIVGGSTMFSRDLLVAIKFMNWRKVSEMNWLDVLQMLMSKKDKK